MTDPYAVLGVARGASADEIKRAYRRLARTMHPDVNANDPKAEERFKALNAAHDLLGDPDKRARYDRGEIDADGNERPFGFGRGPGGGRGYGGFGGGRARTASGGPGADGGFHFRFEDMFKGADTFEDIFARAQSAKRRGAAGAGAGGAGPTKGADANYRLTVSFEEAAKGATRRIALANGKTLDVRVPPGTEAGATLRLRGQGGPGRHGGEAGDARVEIQVRDHPVFRREGFDVVADVPVSLSEAVLGAKITVPTIDGRVAVTVPEGANAATTLRLRGKGIARPDGGRGDQRVRLRITIEDPKDDALRAFLRKWKPKGGQRDVRAEVMPDPTPDPTEEA
jgi:DnaJ-class molecular chaperone